MSGGRPPTSAGSSATATSSTRPCSTAAPTIAFEGAPDHPGPETFYRIIEQNHVTGLFTSPTLVRLLMRYGADVAKRFDLCSLERVFCAGEVLNAPAWEWLQKEVLQRRGAGHRPHVGDGDRRADRRQPLRDRPPADKARLRRHPPARHRGGDHDAGGRALRPQREGPVRHQAALPRPDFAPCGASPSATASTTGSASPTPTSTRPATPRPSTRTATSGSAAAPTR